MRSGSWRVVRLQVQLRPLKAPHGWYDPEPLVAVQRAWVSPAGVLGARDGAWVVDAHHRDHPASRGGGRRALSVGFTGHYEAMAARYGATVSPGIAGENLVVDGPALRRGDLGEGLVIVGADGRRLELRGPRPAAPCREFTSYLLGHREPLPREALEDDLAFLSEGTRGFIATPVGEDEVRVGDEVRLL